MTKEDAIREMMFAKRNVVADSFIDKAYGMAIEALKAQLSTEDTTFGKWIPVSERLPEYDEVLCCDVHGNLMIGNMFVSEKSNTGYSEESEHEYMYDCVAWMPLPSPYKGE